MSERVIRLIPSLHGTRKTRIDADDWQVVGLAEGEEISQLPTGPVIVPLALWKTRRDELIARGDVGVWLKPDDEPGDLATGVERLAIIALHFPKWGEGRGYSSGALLRTQLRLSRRAAGLRRYRPRPSLQLPRTLRLRCFRAAATARSRRRIGRVWRFEPTLPGLRGQIPYRSSASAPRPEDCNELRRTRGPRTPLPSLHREETPLAHGGARPSSFGAEMEDMVLLDLIARDGLSIDIVTLDTGRLPRETHALIAEVRDRYGLEVGLYSPWPDSVQAYVEEHGMDGFYEGVEQRVACCNVRKVEPLRRALSGKRGWITGLRREQAASRTSVTEAEHDPVHGKWKFSPLAEWSNEDVWQYLRENRVPYNALHDRGYPSIGCEPCTRAVKPGEHPRAGRWWWEQVGARKRNVASMRSRCASWWPHERSAEKGHRTLFAWKGL